MKKMKIFLTIIMLILIMPSTIFAFVEDIGNVTPVAPGGMEPMVNKILGIISWAGYGIALGMIMYIGIKYMMSAANEKANMKQAVINYLIGAVVLFAATTIFTVSINFFGGSMPEEDGGGTGGSPEGNAGGVHDLIDPVLPVQPDEFYDDAPVEIDDEDDYTEGFDEGESEVELPVVKPGIPDVPVEL